MKFKDNIKVESGKQTAANLIKNARKIFTEQGYKNASMEVVVHMTGVTRGALYHHFSGKQGLFFAVFEDALNEITVLCEDAMRSSNDPWEKLIVTTRAFFKACMDPELQQIVLIDAPATLGWSVWRQSDEKKTMVILKDILSELIAKRMIKPLPLDALAHIIWGATSELVLWIAHSHNPESTYEKGFDTVIEIFESLKIPDRQ